LATKMRSCLLSRLKLDVTNRSSSSGDREEQKMTDKCTKCGRAKPQINADAKTLGLLQELESGVYTCCQISQWADEQWLAWFKATQEDQDGIIRPEFNEAELVLVSVRLHRQQVPWCRTPDNLGWDRRR
jgi:hypothetical protein